MPRFAAAMLDAYDASLTLLLLLMLH